MMRSLWSAGSGMKAQQLNIDIIANNLSNVNTAGYKKSRAEFKDLIYETLQRPDAAIDDIMGRPVGLQVGHGVRPSATSRDFSGGNLQNTGNTFDVAIEGSGFFLVERADESLAFTRDGSFKTSVDEDERYLVTSEGSYVLDMDEERIELPLEYHDFSISSEGVISGRNEDGEIEELQTLGMVNFMNPEGLMAIGNNMYIATESSGEMIIKEDFAEPGFGTVLQNYLEMANVQVVDEMVNLITAQRAYEVNTKVVQTSDEMLSQANNLRR